MTRRMRARAALAGVVALAACVSDGPTGIGGRPPAPRAFNAHYQAGAVQLSWELSPQWNGEYFRIYSKRTSDQGYFLIAEVTNCAAGVCSFTDVNVAVGVTYLYYVVAVDEGEFESEGTESLQVAVPHPSPPAVPTQVRVTALDDANYVIWDDNARAASDFSHYRVWLVLNGDDYLLGETDSEGFLDLLAENGLTYSYRVTSVDGEGHESQLSTAASGTPRPDYAGEWIYAFADDPGASGFRFEDSEASNPVVDGASPSRHFRLEVDGEGWWLVPGPNAAVFPDGFVTTALKCGVAADEQCEALEQAPTSGYTTLDVALAPQTTYVLRVRGDDGQNHYGAVRVSLLGFDGSDRAIMIFDWAYQLRPGDPSLAPPPSPPGG